MFAKVTNASAPRWALVGMLAIGCGSQGDERAPGGDEGSATNGGAGSRVTGSPGGRAGARDAWMDAGGNPGGGNQDSGVAAVDSQTPEAVTPAARVAISEIMYHPVNEPGPVDVHEFIELYNRSDDPVRVGGWKIGAVGYTFPAGAVIAGKTYAVVAKDPGELSRVLAYGLSPSSLFGPYPGELENSGERVVLTDANDLAMDAVKFDDKFPWPIGADALGASDRWLRADSVPATKHRFMGRSLERYSFDVPAAETSNWGPSPLDGATPGRQNSLAGDPPAIVEVLGALSQAGVRIIRATDKVVVRARFSARGRISSPEVEFFVDSVEKDDAVETKLRVPMTLGADGYEAILPAQGDNAIVRYRIRGDRGKGDDVITPRDSDPSPWHAYFVSPPIAGKTPPYHLFIRRSSWGKLHQFIAPGRVLAGGCAVNPDWQQRVAAVFVADGRVYDVMARYEGGQWNRATEGAVIAPAYWPVAEQPQPAPTVMRALSWRLYFPRYNNFDGKSDVNLNKLWQGCEAVGGATGGRIYQAAGIPAANLQYVRLYINGRYYHYMGEYEHIGAEMLTRFFGKTHVVGDLFKSVGHLGDQGPYGWGDGALLPPYCGYTTEQRMDYTFSRTTPDWKTGSAEVTKLSRELMAARASLPSVTATRAFFATNFDLNLLTTYVALRNWNATGDDFFHNFYFYLRTDGKWMMIPTDFELDFGSSQASFYIGEAGDRSNRILLGWRNGTPWWNDFKDAFIKSYRTEVQQALTALSAAGQPLHPDTVAGFVAQSLAGYVVAEAAEAPGALSGGYSKACSGAINQATALKSFAKDRYARVQQGAWK